MARTRQAGLLGRRGEAFAAAFTAIAALASSQSTSRWAEMNWT